MCTLSWLVLLTEVKLYYKLVLWAGKLKEMGNSLLGRFGMSVDNFKAVKDPNSGSYSISFQRWVLIDLVNINRVSVMEAVIRMGDGGHCFICRFQPLLQVKCSAALI